MRLGIFAKTFPRSTFEQTFDAIKSLGLDCIQFNFKCAGLPPLPESIELGLARRIRAELESRSIAMAAVSGTCNLIHPNAAQREVSIGRLQMLIEICRELGTSVVTLCTGTREPNDMWRAHVDNDSVEAWRDLQGSLERLLPIAENQRVALGIEPEPANVIGSARQARRLLNEMRSSCLRIVFDAANLVEPHGLSTQRQILQQAFDLLGEDIVLAHAKDLDPRPSAAQSSSSRRASACTPSSAVVAAGKGKLDYGLYLSLLRRARFNGPVILHNLSEAEAPESITFLREIINVTLDQTQANALLRPR